MQQRSVWEPPTSTEVRRFTQRDYVRTLEDTGWLAALPDATQQVLLARIAKQYGEGHALAPQGYRLAATDFCDALAVTQFDAEMIDGQGPREPCSYHGLIRQLAAASFGQFAPTKINDKLAPKDERAYVSFQLGGRTFSIDVPLRNDWVELDVIDVLVNGALRDSGAASRFRALPTTDQCVALAFIPDEVWRKAVDAGVIPAHLVAPVRERKPCTEQELAARLPPGEGVAGLHEWTTQLREAIASEVRAQGRASIEIGLGVFAVRPGRAPGQLKLSFRAAEALKDIVNGRPAELDDDYNDDDVVKAVVSLLREGYDEFPLDGIGTLRVRAVPAFSAHWMDSEVQFGAKNAIELDFTPAFVAALRSPAKRKRQR